MGCGGSKADGSSSQPAMPSSAPRAPQPLGGNAGGAVPETAKLAMYDPTVICPACRGSGEAPKGSEEPRKSSEDPSLAVTPQLKLVDKAAAIGADLGLEKGTPIPAIATAAEAAHGQNREGEPLVSRIDDAYKRLCAGQSQAGDGEAGAEGEGAWYSLPTAWFGWVAENSSATACSACKGKGRVLPPEPQEKPSSVFLCPSCGVGVYDYHVDYRFNQCGKCYTTTTGEIARCVGRCECGALVCIECHQLAVVPHQCAKLLEQMAADVGSANASDKFKPCPACGIMIEKIDGDDTVMCGCEARPAGGTYEKALAGGGCGHEFNFKTLAPIGTGKPGEPANDRQRFFAAGVLAA